MLDFSKVLYQSCSAVGYLETAVKIQSGEFLHYLVLQLVLFFFFYSQMSKVWNELKPKLSCLFVGSSNMPTPPLSPPDGNFFSN